MKKPAVALKEFSISGLFGRYNVRIPFTDKTIILIGENGSGKTTILNLLYYSISCRYYKLSGYPFDEIVLSFDNGVSITINRETITTYPNEIFGSRLLQFVRRELTEEQLFDLVSALIAEKESPEALLQSVHYRQLFRTIPLSVLKEELGDVKKNPGLMNFISNFQKTKEYLPQSILNFPTYRRIEEDIQNLGLDKEKIGESLDKSLIRFGMKDVIERFSSLTDEIKNKTIEGFNIVTGDMLSKLVSGVPPEMKDEHPTFDKEIIKKVLDRIGNGINSADKLKILKLLDEGNIFEEQYKFLPYFITRLTSMYESQKEMDNAIKSFAQICNGYLWDKKVTYNESTVSIDITTDKDSRKMDLDRLSSGEKQIVSLFAKVYLDYTSNFIILFDEPELSLSIDWQKKLLPDILASNRCDLLLATTHSPFIFENDLDVYAKPLTAFLTEK